MPETQTGSFIKYRVVTYLDISSLHNHYPVTELTLWEKSMFAETAGKQGTRIIAELVNQGKLTVAPDYPVRLH